MQAGGVAFLPYNTQLAKKMKKGTKPPIKKQGVYPRKIFGFVWQLYFSTKKSVCKYKK